MKVKLLKKVRKRFEIFHLPNGKMFDNIHYNYNLFELVDNDGGYWPYDKYAQLRAVSGKYKFCESIFDTEKECIDYLRNNIIKILRSETYNQSSKSKRINNNRIKVWYKKK
jgi:hypothetical protein